MLLPDLVVRAVRDPLTQGNPGEMHRLLDAVDGLTARLGTSATGVRALLSAAGQAVREALAREGAALGPAELGALVRRGAGLTPDPAAVSALFGPDERRALDARAAAASGLDPAAVAEALPVVVPLVLKLLDAGSPVRHGECLPNAVLDAFMDANDPADADVGEAVRMLAATYAAKR